jgi:hypothetical protein
MEAGRDPSLDVLDALCVRLFGATPDEHRTYTIGPEGPVRGTRRLQVGGRVVYATHRQSADGAAKEARVLRALEAHGAPVAPCIAFEDGWLLQESVGDEPLSETLDAVSPEEARALLVQALEGLAQVQAAGAAARLAEAIEPFATGPKTAAWLLANFQRIATACDEPLPAIDAGALTALLAAPGETFIKWDARPANAAVGSDGVVRWFDWLHANVRHATDDPVWLLCDETVPTEVRAPDLLLARVHDVNADVARACAAGVAHVGVRLHGILSDPKTLELSWSTCRANDWLGSREAARRLCRRGADLARRDPLTAPLSMWFARVEDRLLRRGTGDA